MTTVQTNNDNCTDKQSPKNSLKHQHHWKFNSACNDCKVGKEMKPQGTIQHLMMMKLKNKKLHNKSSCDQIHNIPNIRQHLSSFVVTKILNLQTFTNIISKYENLRHHHIWTDECISFL